MAARAWELEQGPDLGTGMEMGIAPGMAPARPQRAQDAGVLMLLRLRGQMKQKLVEYGAAIRGGQEDFLDHVEDKLFQSTAEELKSEVEETEVSFWNKISALQRIQLTDAMRNKANQGDKDSCLILETINRIMLLSRTIIKYKQQAREKEQRLTAIKRKRLSLKKDEGQKLQQIQTMKEKQKEKQGNMNPTEAKMLHNLEKERDLTAVIQNVFQNIILGSGVNWAEDPALKAVVLQLEKNVQLQ